MKRAPRAWEFISYLMVELLELARVEWARYNVDRSPEVLIEVEKILSQCKNAIDVEHVEWLLQLADNSRILSYLVRSQAIRIVHQWAKDMQAVIEEDGIPILDPIRHDLIDGAVLFLQQVASRSSEDKVDFLIEKGLNNTEIQLAFVQVGIDIPDSLGNETVRGSMVDNGASFLKMDQIKSKSFQDRISFLKSKGLNDTEIYRACQAAGISPHPSKEDISKVSGHTSKPIREEMVSNGATFLSDPSVVNKSVEEKLKFLQKKGLSGAEIRTACERFHLVINQDLVEEYFDKVNETIQTDDTLPAVHVVEFRDDMVSKGIKFLNHPSAAAKSTAEKSSFLKSKGLTVEEINKSYESWSNGGGTQENQQVEKAKRFISHPSAASKSLREKVQFLRSKGISDNDIKTACRAVGISMNNTRGEYIRPNWTAATTMYMNCTSADDTLETEALRRKQVNDAKEFLLKEETISEPVEKKISFLLGKGILKQHIKEAFFMIGIHVEDSLIEGAASGDLNEDQLNQAIEFIKNSDKQDPEKLMDFLSTIKMIPMDIIREAFQSAGYSTEEIDNFILENRETLIELGISFLKQPGVNPRDQSTVDFLLKKGLAPNEIETLVQTLNLDASKIQHGKNFLMDDDTSRSSFTDKVRFLKSKGLNEQEIIEAFKAANVPMESVEQESQNVLQKSIAYLKNPLSAAYSTEEKTLFLRSKSIPEGIIQKAFESVRMFEHDDPPASRHIEQAKSFLESPQRSGYSDEECREYLRNKGLSEGDIQQAFVLATPQVQAPAELRADKVNQAIQFLKTDAADAVKLEQQLEFLRNKGLSELEIKHAVEVVGKVHVPSRSELMERGAVFLSDSNLKSTPVEDRVQYLLSKGLTQEEVSTLALEAQLDLTPSYLSSIPIATLKEQRFSVPADLSPSGKCLQRAMNVCVSILIENPADDNLNCRAVGLLALSMCRCRAAGINHSCVAFSGKVLGRAVVLSNIGPESNRAAIEDVIQSLVELVGREDQINRYAKKGLRQSSQVNLKFVSMESILQGLGTGWISQFECIPFDDAMILTRAFHNVFCKLASTQTYETTSGPLVSALLIMAHNPDAVDVVMYICAGLLRGASEFAWAKDTATSPRPDVEKCIRRTAAEAMDAVDNSLGRSKGVAASTGLACVYADKELEWDSRVFQVVTEGLLNGALWPTDALDGLDVSLDQRAVAATSYVGSELFKMVPNLVQLLLYKMDTEKPLQSTWVLQRLRQHTISVFDACGGDAGLGHILARRTTHLLYGSTGDTVDGEAVGNKENNSNGDTSSDIKRKEVVDETEDEEEDVDNETPKQEEAVNPAPDLLEQQLGVHSGLARLMQMGYISVVVLGNKAVSKGLDSDAWMLLDTLANLNAFQVRVQDVVQLESVLPHIMGLRNPETANALVYRMVTSPAVLKVTSKVNWMVAARTEYLMGVFEPYVLDRWRRICSSQSYISTSHVKLPELKIISSRSVMEGRSLKKKKRAKEVEKAFVVSDPEMASSVYDCILNIAIVHEFEHLNHRGHSWMTSMIAQIHDKIEPELPLRLTAIVPYVEMSLRSRDTKGSTLSFVFGSIFTSLSRDPDPRSHCICVMAFDRLLLAIESLQRTDRTDGPILYALLFACLKAVPVYMIDHAQNSVSLLMGNAINNDTAMSRDALQKSLFGAILRTSEAPRRTILARWFLQSIEGLTLGGHL